MRARGASNARILFYAVVGQLSPKKRPVPFLGPGGGQHERVGIVTAIAFDPLAHGRARRRHNRNRQNATCRELQSFMRFWRVTEADNVWEDNRGDELNALLPGAQ